MCVFGMGWGGCLSVHLWYEFADDVEWLVEVSVVEEGETDAEQHVHHSQYHTQLHLERVQEVQLVVRHLPDLHTTQSHHASSFLTFA